MKTALRILGLCAVIAGSMSVPAHATHGQQEYAIVYYDDENHTNIVGQFIRFCDGHIFRNGGPSLYSEEHYYGCP